MIPVLPLVPNQYTVRAGVSDARSHQELGLFGHEDAPLIIRVEGNATVADVGMTATNQLMTLDVDWGNL